MSNVVGLFGKEGSIAKRLQSGSRVATHSPEMFKYASFHAFQDEYARILTTLNKGEVLNFGGSDIESNSMGGMMGLNMHMQYMNSAKQVFDSISDGLLNAERQMLSRVSSL